MKRFRLICIAVMLIIVTVGIEAASWKKYVTGSYSFQYPAGWSVNEQESGIEVSNGKTKEELLIVGVPFDKSRSPLLLAKGMVALLKQGIPDLKATGYRENEGSVYFQTTYSEKGIEYSAEVLVVKDTASAMWFSYSAPVEGYDRKYALELLQNFVGSIASGSSSQAPGSSTSVVSLEKNARAFLFVLEFALGAPLNHSQEKVILDELLDGWKTQSRESLKKFDSYPQVVALILSSGQHELEKLRVELEKSTREWLEESDQNDPVVRIVRKQLQAKSKILASNNPALTEMAASAYSEMAVFAEILPGNPNASPAEISASKVEHIRRLLQENWSRFSVEERNDVLTTPGLWITFRTLLQYGSAGEKEKVRLQLKKLAPTSGSVKTSKPMSMIEHNVMMNINQMTFNTYLWSRGFKSAAFGY